MDRVTAEGTDRPVRILSIDGGGMRGIIPARVLMELERLTGLRVGQMFDIVAGTSTGGILALGSTQPGADNAGHAVEDVLRLYTLRGRDIFPAPKLRGEQNEDHPHARTVAAHLQQQVGAVVRPRRYGNSRYSPQGLDSALRECVGDTRLSEATADVLVPAYDMLTAHPVIFSSRLAREGMGPDPLMWDVLRATTAAPTFFPAVHLEGPGYEFVCIDGGVVANNPATVAYTEALRRRHLAGRELDVVIVSLGTGTAPHDHPTHEEIRSRGMLKVAMGMLGVVFDGTSDIADHLLREIISWQEPASHYYRFQVELNGPSLDFDDASEENIDALLRLSDHLIASRRHELAEVAALLVAECRADDASHVSPNGATP